MYVDMMVSCVVVMAPNTLETLILERKINCVIGCPTAAEITNQMSPRAYVRDVGC